jgi:DNA-binding LacI/PurR family transcriptional regulator
MSGSPFPGCTVVVTSIRPVPKTRTLTTVKQDWRRIGQELVRLVLEQIRTTATIPRDRVLIPPELVVRGTAAPARDR